MKEAIRAALVAARHHNDALARGGAESLCAAWNRALFTAFDAARPPGSFESWVRRSFPSLAAWIRVARLEATSPGQSDSIHLSAVTLFESEHLFATARED